MAYKRVHGRHSAFHHAPERSGAAGLIGLVVFALVLASVFGV